MINFLSLFFNHRKKTALAKAIDTAAWSEGKELVGRNSCNAVCAFKSDNHKITDGLDLSIKNWIKIFIHIENKLAKKVNRAEDW